jgi:hypothetical protein
VELHAGDTAAMRIKPDSMTNCVISYELLERKAWKPTFRICAKERDKANSILLVLLGELSVEQTLFSWQSARSSCTKSSNAINGAPKARKTLISSNIRQVGDALVVSRSLSESRRLKIVMTDNSRTLTSKRNRNTIHGRVLVHSRGNLGIHCR